MMVKLGRGMYPIVFLMVLLIFGPVGCKEQPAGKGTVAEEVKAEKDIEAEPAEQDYEEHYENVLDAVGQELEGDEPDEGS